jgi:hypothetical protein
MSLITILATQAGFTEDDCNSPALFKIIARFAELVREDEREQMSSICKDVIAREREACAKFCDRAAKSIRGRKKNG